MGRLGFPAGIIPAQLRLNQGADALQVGQAALLSQQAQAHAAQQQVIQVLHTLLAGSPAQFSPQQRQFVNLGLFGGVGIQQQQE